MRALQWVQHQRVGELLEDLDKIEEKYQKAHLTLNTTKDDVKRMACELDAILSFGCYLYADVLGSTTFTVRETNDEYTPLPESHASQEYRARVAKALEHKQKHSAGFDGQGGGRARGGV